MANVNDWQWVLRKKAKLGLALAVWLGTSSSLAQPKATTVAREKQAPSIEARVEKLYNQGVAAANRQDWANAEKYFEEALTLGKIPQIAANLGDVELQLGKSREAAEHLDYVLREIPDADRDEREEIEQLLVQAQVRTVTVHVSSNVDGTAIFIDDVPYGNSPLNKRIFLEPGSHTFVGEKAGYGTYRHSIDLAIGSKITEELVMKPLRKAQKTTEKVGYESKYQYRLAGFIASGTLAIGGVGTGIWLKKLASDDSRQSMQAIEDLADDTPSRFQSNRGVCDDPANLSQCEALTKLSARAETRGNLSSVAFALAGTGLVGLGLTFLLPRSRKFHIAAAVESTGAGFSITQTFF